MLGIKNLKYVYKISFLAGMNSRLVAKEHVATEFWSYYKERTIPFCVCIFYEESILFYPKKSHQRLIACIWWHWIEM